MLRIDHCVGYDDVLSPASCKDNHLGDVIRSQGFAATTKQVNNGSSVGMGPNQNLRVYGIRLLFVAVEAYNGEFLVGVSISLTQILILSDAPFPLGRGQSP